MKTRIVFCLFPDMHRAPMMDSGLIDGRCGVGFVSGDPLFEDGRLLEFETYEAALEGAGERGLTDAHILKTIISVVMPSGDPCVANG